jgi:rfaE bifunctional protein nucleotidyltransferase chain/domain
MEHFINLFDINHLEKYISELRQSHKGCSVVHCHGVFDILHPGHIDHLLEAKSLGDVLVVTVTDDKYVNKGPGRPIQNANSRAKILSSLKFVDFVAISEYDSAREVIRIVKPTVYVKGPDYINAKDDISGNIAPEQLEVEKYGGRIHFTSAPTQSSSKIINDSGIGFSSEITNYLKFKFYYA